MTTKASDSEFDYVFKFILVGDAGVGKSCLLARFVENEFNESTATTIGVEFGTRICTVGGKRIKLQLWDTAGQEVYRSVVRSYYRNAAGVIMVYDVTSRASYNSLMETSTSSDGVGLPSWLSDVRQHCSPDVVTLLVGNKTDLEASREVTRSEAALVAQQNDMLFLEASAKTGSGVFEDGLDGIFETIARAILGRIEAGTLDPETRAGVEYGTTSPITVGPRRTGGKSGVSNCCGGGAKDGL